MVFLQKSYHLISDSSNSAMKLKVVLFNFTNKIMDFTAVCLPAFHSVRITCGRIVVTLGGERNGRFNFLEGIC